MLDGAARVGDLMKAVAEQGMPAIAVTDHGNNFGAYDFWKQATEAGIKPIIGTEAYITPGNPSHRQDPRALGQRRRRRRLGVGRLHAHDAARREHRRACTTCSGCRRSPRSRATTSSPAWTASCSSTYATGLIATTGCPSGEVQTRLRLGQYDEAVTGGGRVPRHLRRRELLRRDHGPRPRHRAPRHGRPAAARQGARPPAGRDQRPALHARARRERAGDPALRSSPARRWPIRTASSSTSNEFYLKTPAADAPAVLAIIRRRATTPCSSPSAARSSSTPTRTHAALPGARGRDREHSWFVKEVEKGLADAVSGRHPRSRCASAGRLRDRGHQRRWASPATSSSSPTSSAGRETQGIRVGPGRGSGAGSMAAYAMRHHRPRPASTRTDLRAVPQPRSRLDARLRCRLRRAPPRRGHPTTSPRSTATSASPRSSPTARSRPSRR